MELSANHYDELYYHFGMAMETAQVKADPEALRALAEARQAVRDGDVVYGTEAVRGLLRGRRAS